MKEYLYMDAETISTLKTVVTAGHAASGFNGELNARLERMEAEGLLMELNPSKHKGPRRAYQPTEKGKEVVRKLALGAA